MRYLWIKNHENGKYDLEIVDDPIFAWKNGMFNESKDKLFQIGGEVKLEVVLKPVHAQRNAGLKGDLGIGDYRG